MSAEQTASTQIKTTGDVDPVSRENTPNLDQVAQVIQEVTEKEMSREQKQFTEELQGKLSILEEKQKEEDNKLTGNEQADKDQEEARLAEEAAKKHQEEEEARRVQEENQRREAEAKAAKEEADRLEAERV